MRPPARPSDPAAPLVGVWKLESAALEFEATGEKRALYGARPNGYLIFTAEQRMMGLVTAEQRQPPRTDAEAVSAFRSMLAYSGTYRVEGDRWITKVDVAWNEAWTGTEQVRVFTLDGDTLTVTTMWQPNVNLPGRPETRGVLAWSRVRMAPSPPRGEESK